MSNDPQIQERAAQHYAGIRMTVPMDGISGAVDEAFPELFGWLAGKTASPQAVRRSSATWSSTWQLACKTPAWGCRSMRRSPGAGAFSPASCPEGRYAVLRHTGPYDGLMAANAALQQWASEHSAEFDVTDTAEGQAWRSRVEHYLTNPAQEPDPAKWEVDVAYLTRQA